MIIDKINNESRWSGPWKNIWVIFNFRLSQISGTVNEVPEGFTEFPYFPGIDPEKLKGKKFESIALDIQVIADGKIKQTWHLEDYQSAVDQMVNGNPVPDFGFPTSEYLSFWKC